MIRTWLAKDGSVKEVRHEPPPFRKFYDADPDEQLKGGPPTPAEIYAEVRRQEAIKRGDYPGYKKEDPNE